MSRVALIGPTYPYRGGIAHYTTLLARHLRRQYEVRFISFSRQYPRRLFPGESDQDPSQQPLRAEAEYLLDPINPITWRRTAQLLQSWQPATLLIPWWHPYFAPAWGWISRALKKGDQPPRLIFICHNVLPHEQGQTRRLLPVALRWALGRGDGFLVHAGADGKLLRAYLPQARLALAPLPHAELGSSEHMAGAVPFSLPVDRPLLLFCGLVRPYKGLDVLLEALALVQPLLPSHLLIAGEFWQGGETQYRQQIEQLGLAEAVTIWNAYLPDEALTACVDRADVVVLPYKSGTQSGIIQLAFGRGKPVITTDVGGLGEVVADGRTGLVVPPEDPAALAAAIVRYFQEDLAESFRQNIEVDDRFSWENYVKTLETLMA